MNHDFFITWSKQKGVELPEIDFCDDYYFYHGDKKYLELSSISFQMSFGLQNQQILKAISNQMSLLSSAAPKSNFNLKRNVSAELIKLLDNGPGKIFYTVSGAESVENALKMVRLATGKQKIMARTPSYHGATYGALAVTGDWRNAPHKTSDDVIRIPEPKDDPNCEQLENLMKSSNDIAALILETVTGGNGVIIIEKRWWQKASELCKKYNIRLIVDEVICGFYRTGKTFGFHHYDIKPDFVCMAKGISGGLFPIGAVFVSKEMANYFDENVLSCGLTNYAHPLGLASISAVIDIIQNKENLKLIKENIETLKNELAKIAKMSSVKTIRQIGMLAIIEHYKTLNAHNFFEKGLMVYHHPHDIILSPNLLMPKNLLKEGLKKIGGLLE